MTEANPRQRIPDVRLSVHCQAAGDGNATDPKAIACPLAVSLHCRYVAIDVNKITVLLTFCF